MRTIEIQGRSSVSRALVGERLRHVDRYAPPGRTIVLADANVHRLHGGEFPPWPTILLDGGEANKTLDSVARIYRDLLGAGADRSTFILVVGGGVVCDMAGFAASTYMRGLPFGFVATTLLAQVDASVGGKNGVNLDGFKNIVGVFEHPQFVLCDPWLLRTLPAAEAANGFAEAVKHGLIGDPGLLDLLENETDKALALEPVLMEEIVQASLAVKAAVVGRDEREAGERKVLNFGHTMAHAIETAYGLSHGEAVAIGLVFALRLSLRKGILRNAGLVERTTRVLQRFGLPTVLARDPRPLLEAAAKDKKRAGEMIDLVLLEDLGKPRLHRLSLDALKEDIVDLCQPA